MQPLSELDSEIDDDWDLAYRSGRIRGRVDVIEELLRQIEEHQYSVFNTKDLKDKLNRMRIE